MASGGGALSLVDNSSLVVMDGVVLRQNRSQGMKSFMLPGTAFFRLVACLLPLKSFLSVRAESYGGAVFADGNSSVSCAGRIEGNIAGLHGGGIAALSTASIALQSGVLFTQNSAVGSGGCAYFGGGSVTVGEQC